MMALQLTYFCTLFSKSGLICKSLSQTTKHGGSPCSGCKSKRNFSLPLLLVLASLDDRQSLVVLCSREGHIKFSQLSWRNFLLNSSYTTVFESFTVWLTVDFRTFRVYDNRILFQFRHKLIKIIRNILLYFTLAPSTQNLLLVHFFSKKCPKMSSNTTLCT